MAQAKIGSFKDLRTWQAAYTLSLDVYRVTGHFPESERFGLTNQLRRASVSVASNIAEGFSRQGVKEKTQFYHMSRGSLSEVECQLLIAQGVGYLKEFELKSLQDRILMTHKLLTALLKTAQQK